MRMPKPLAPDAIKRLEMRLPARSFDRLKKLVEDTEAESYAQVIRESLQLYEWVVRANRAGGEFGVRRPGGEFEVVQLLASVAD